MSLTVAAAFAVVVWLAAGLAGGGLWVEFALFAASAALVAELSNRCALIRIYSAMVPCVFIALMCSAPFLFASLSVTGSQLCLVASVSVLLRCYQDRLSPGRTFYAFACLGLASLFYVRFLYFVPVYWLLMAFPLRSMSWRTAAASALGVCLPYWLCLPVAMATCGLPALSDHFRLLGVLWPPFDMGALTVNRVALLAFVVVLGVTGAVHFYRHRIDDKIRTRMFFNCFTVLAAASAALAVAQPQLYDMAMAMMIVCVSPLAGHFIALTRTRLTNIAFCLMAAAALLLTVFNLWMPSTRF